MTTFLILITFLLVASTYFLYEIKCFVKSSEVYLSTIDSKVTTGNRTMVTTLFEILHVLESNDETSISKK